MGPVKSIFDNEAGSRDSDLWGSLLLEWPEILLQLDRGDGCRLIDEFLAIFQSV